MVLASQAPCSRPATAPRDHTATNPARVSRPPTMTRRTAWLINTQDLAPLARPCGITTAVPACRRPPADGWVDGGAAFATGTSGASLWACHEVADVGGGESGAVAGGWSVSLLYPLDCFSVSSLCDMYACLVVAVRLRWGARLLVRGTLVHGVEDNGQLQHRRQERAPREVRKEEAWRNHTMLKSLPTIRW